MRVPGRRRAARVLRWLRSRAGARALVLGYHRIAEPAGDAYDLCVSPANFREQLAALCREATPISLEELREGLCAGRLPRRAVVVTLDDGYADALSDAAPALRAAAVPATVFVTVGCLGRVPWWEELASTVAAAPELPERLSLRVDGATFGWSSPSRSAGADARSRRIVELHRTLLPWSEACRAQALAALRRALGVGAPPARPPRLLTEAELRELARCEGIAIGAHSRTHPLLGELPVARQRSEIGESRRDLEALVGRKVDAFSYPNGSSSLQTRQLVRDAGYRVACGSLEGVASLRSDLFHLPRFWIGNRSGAQLTRWLRRWR